MDLEYRNFKTKTPAEQGYDLISIEKSIENFDPKILKFFLRELFLDGDQDFYLRKRSLQLLGYLTLIGKINNEFTVALLLDIDNNTNEHVVMSALKIGSHLSHKCKEPILKWGRTFIFNSNAEIRSEAFNLLAKSKFFDALSADSPESLVTTFYEAIDYFDKCVSEIENRADAAIFSEIANFILISRTGNRVDWDTSFSKIKSQLWTYITFSTNRDDSVFFASICQSIDILHYVTIHDPENWIDYRVEMNELSKEVLRLEVIQTTAEFSKADIVNDFSAALRENVIFQRLIDKFKNQLSRLRRLKMEMLLETKVQEDFLDELIAAILHESDKKKDLADATEVTLRLHASFPRIPIDRIRESVLSLAPLSPVTVSELFETYCFESRQTTDNTTGYPQGDEILKIIIDKLREEIPDYPQSKFLELILVLRDTINYFINTSRGSELRFPFLYNSTAKEVDLQESMMTHFSTSNRASKYTPEVVEAADGGRVDILFKSNSLELPLELKRSSKQLTWELVQSDYLSQAQTYAHTRDQIGFFIVLDLSAKPKIAPSPNIRDLFQVIHLKPNHSLGINFPDYVVCFIVEGNKLSPHERSKYS